MAEDTLEAWLQVRASLSPTTLPPPASNRGQVTMAPQAALSRHIECRVRRRDEARAGRFLAAVTHLETLVARPPDVDGLAGLVACLQGVGGPAPLRTTTAFAHGGRAVMRPHSRGELIDAVRGADVQEDGPAWFRAARLYADVCFFHPFDDGNARLALCALVWVLARAGTSVVDLSPVVMPWVPSTAPALCRVVRAISAT